MAQAADFFVSYTGADRAWAEWIAWQLEAEGYKVVIQAWDFTPGHDWAHEMQEATATAERVVAVLSPAYLRSAYGEAEWRAYFAQDPSGKQRRLLPVLVGQVELPGLLKTRVYVDLADQDVVSARAKLLAAARGGRGKPATEPGFPGIQQRMNKEMAPQFPGDPENRILSEPGIHRWVWPRDPQSSGSPSDFQSPSPIYWPTLPPVGKVQHALKTWAGRQRLLSPSAFEGELVVQDATIIQLRVTTAFDDRREEPVELRPGPVSGQSEVYEGSLQHAHLLIDRGELRWQNTSDWWGIRQDWRRQECLACRQGWLL